MKLKVTVDGKTYEVDVEAAEPEAARSAYEFMPAQVRVPAAAAPPPQQPGQQDGPPVDEAKVCRSPVSAIVVTVSAQVGQAVQTGDVLVVVEAMKMQTTVTASAPGKVAGIKVKEGDGVRAGQILMEFE